MDTNGDPASTGQRLSVDPIEGPMGADVLFNL